jgi:putative transcriptional regulator
VKLVRQKLIDTRQENDMTLQQVADAIGVSKPYYYMIESGKRGLSYELAVKISSVFNKNPDDIFLSLELTIEKQDDSAS